jgi:uncharacterized membrane protein
LLAAMSKVAMAVASIVCDASPKTPAKNVSSVSRTVTRIALLLAPQAVVVATTASRATPLV